MQEIRGKTTTPPPFTFVGLDVFCPWQILTRKTRGGAACSKRWVVILTCLNIRAVHIELVESMDASSFIYAFRSFLGIRGSASQLQCDNGANFVGARNELDAARKEIDQQAFNSYLNLQHCKLIFNPPHGSHCGGGWERIIGICGKILESMLANIGPVNLHKKFFALDRGYGPC